MKINVLKIFLWLTNGVILFQIGLLIVRLYKNIQNLKVILTYHDNNILAKASMLNLIGWSSIVLSIISTIYLRKFILNLARKEVFTKRNVFFIKRISIYFVLSALLSLTSVFLMYLYIQYGDTVRMSNLPIFRYILSHNLSIIYFALFIGCFAYAFSMGVKLKNENDLTI